MNKKLHAVLETYFKQQHDNPPEPLNPEYRPYAVQLAREVTESMVKDRHYRNRSLEECSLEWKRRYEELRPAYEEEFQRELKSKKNGR